MNEHDLLDAIGSIDKKYIEDADQVPARKVIPFKRYATLAAALVLLTVTGILLKNNAAFFGSPVGEPEGKAVDGQDIYVAEAYEGEADKESVTAGDYPAMLMVDGVIYKSTGDEYIGELDTTKAATVGDYTDDAPTEDNQQNFDRTSTATYLVIDDDTIVVFYEGTWHTFERAKE